MQDQDISFLRYKIPPNFQLVNLHARATLPYKKKSKIIQTCQCCYKNVKKQKISYFVSTQQLSQFGQQIPMFFYILKATSIFLLFIILIKIGGYQFCNLFSQKQCSFIHAKIIIPQIGKLQIPVGYQQTDQILNFVQFMIFAFSILILKFFIKMKKYKIKSLTAKSIGRNTLKLINVHKQATVQQIKQIFEPYQIKVVLTYKFKQLEETLNNYNKLLKYRALKINNKGPYVDKKLKDINLQIQQQKRYLDKIKKSFKSQNNRLSLVYVVFRSSDQKNLCYLKFKRSIFSRLFFKFCTCCSDTSINGQSFTVKTAQQPNDIIWQNIQNPYCRTKFKRFLSIAICIILLFFGMSSEYLIPYFLKQNTIWISFIKAGIILILNFIIMVLLEFTTQKIQSYESHTQRHLTLVKKLTSFLFLNISLSSLMGYYFQITQEQYDEEKMQSIMEDFAFSVIILALANIFKPLPIWLSVDRFFKMLNRFLQKRKCDQCTLTQIQANKQFQPVQFPISTFYSLSLSSLMMVCFYCGRFQMLLIIEFFSLVLLFFVSKWMLLRVCKSPAGLARKISNLAQNLLRVLIGIQWIGTNIIGYLQKNSQQKSKMDIFQFLLRDTFSFIQIGIIIFWLFFLDKFLSKFCRFVIKIQKRSNKDSQISDIDQRQNMLNNEDSQIFQSQQSQYSNANLHIQLVEQCEKFFKVSSKIQK